MSSIVLSRDILAETIAVLRRGGARGEERVALWLGSAANREPAPIVEVYEPEQITARDMFEIPPESMRVLMGHLRATRRRIVAQIHTHPQEAFHSGADARWAIVRQVGALSLVLPRFAADTSPDNFLHEVKTYEYSPAGDWDERPNHGPGARVLITP